MTDDEQIAQQEIFRFLKDTSHIFTDIKKYSILVEEILPAHKAPIHPAKRIKKFGLSFI